MGLRDSKVGQRLCSEDFGEGIVTEINEKGVVVKFEKQDDEVTLEWSEECDKDGNKLC